MNNFDKIANSILQRLVVEGIEEKCEVVKVNVPGTGLVDINVKCIKTSTGCRYIADEDVDGGIVKGQDVTDIISENFDEDEDVYIDTEGRGDVQDYLNAHKSAVAAYVDDYVNNSLESGVTDGDDIDDEGLELNALDYLKSLSFAEVVSELSKYIADSVEDEEDIPEENAEDEDLAKVLGGKDPSKQLAAVTVAGKLATQASGGVFGFNTPQKKMNTAYGNLMSKIANKIDGIASKI